MLYYITLYLYSPSKSHLSGPVRSCAFHPTQPLFVSAGDDGILKVFNHRQRKLLFSLSGHLDYVRSVAFHHEAPWIVSASDDQTVRIWNWQSRQCVAVLSGHNHYVMCAAFHPSEDLLVSASLDQTVRVWDLSNIRAKNAPSITGNSGRKGSFGSGSPASPTSSSPQIDLFAGSGLDTSVKFILEGHDRGVNWVQFHPTKPLILSGSDDRTVKIWRFNDVRAWEIETLRGHMNNVSAVLWHPRAEFVLSDSEDRTLRIWDCSGASGSLSSRGKCVMSLKKDNDRFWCLAAHPEMNIFAAGHDNGLIVFKMNRERPPYALTPDAATSGDCLFYVRDKLVRSFALDSGTDSDEFVAALDHSLKLPATLSFSPTERAILIASADGTGTAIQLRDKAAGSHVFTGTFATFVGRNRFVTLSNGVITLQSVGASNDAKALPIPDNLNVLRLLPGPLGTFLAASPSTVHLMDGTSGRVISSIDAAGVKYVSWSPNFDHVALMAKRTIYLSDKSFKSVHVVHSDSTGVKSGTWDVSNPLGAIFYYTNAFHLKYLLPAGDSGIICTTSTPLYLVRVRGDLVHVLDRSSSVLVLGIDPTECQFKLALQRGNSQQIEHLIANSNLVGQAIIAYLREKGHSAIALQFVKDPSSRFDLALECDNLEIAWEAAESLKSPAIWNKLAEEALQAGKTEIALKAYTLAGNSTKISFLSTLLGISESSASDPFAVVMNGSPAEITKTFIDSGLPVLGHLASSGRTAVTAEAPQLGNFLMRRSQVTAPSNPSTADWPLLFDPSVKIVSTIKACETNVPVCDDGWGGDIELLDEPAAAELDDLDIPLDEDDLALLGDSGALASEFFDLDLPDTLPEDIATQGFGVSITQFTEELKAQNGLVAMSQEMIEAVERIVAAQTFYLPGNFGTRPLSVPNSYNSLNFGEDELFPSALQATTQGRFPEALNHFRKFLQLSAVSPIARDPKDLLLARDYIVGLIIELSRKELGDTGDQATILDLAVLFTRCPLKPEHHLLSLRAALAAAYKFAAYKTAAHLARRILSLPQGTAPDAVILQARKVLSVAEKANYSESVEGIKYGAFADDQPWTVDPVDFMRLNPENGNELFECLYCRTKYGREHDCCAVCQIGAISRT